MPGVGAGAGGDNGFVTALTPQAGRSGPPPPGADGASPVPAPPAGARSLRDHLSRPGQALRRTWRTTGPLAAPLLVLTAMQWIGTFASPALLQPAPLLLAFLSPRTPFLLYASSQSPLVLFVVVASIRALAADPINYCIGRKLGPALFARLEARGGRAARVIRLSERVIDRCGVVAVACRPNAAMLGLAGARRLNPVATGIAAVVGTTSYLTVLALTAGAVASPIQGVVNWLSAEARNAWDQLAATPPAVPAAAAAVVVAAIGGALWWYRSRPAGPVPVVNVATARSSRAATGEPRP